MRYAATRAFTLIELLVVITIITILLAMLTPSLERAIGQAERALCMTNERAIGQAIHWYMMDHKRAFPNEVPYQEVDGANIYPLTPYPPGVSPPHQLLVEYTGGIAAFTCPTDPSPTDFAWWVFNDYPDFFRPDPEGKTHDAQRDILGTAAGTMVGPGHNLGASYMFSEQVAMDYRPYKDSMRQGSPTNAAYMSDGFLVVNSRAWWHVDPYFSSNVSSPSFWNLRIDWSHLESVNMLMTDLSVHSVKQDGEITYRIRSDPKLDRLPQF